MGFRGTRRLMEQKRERRRRPGHLVRQLEPLGPLVRQPGRSERSLGQLVLPSRPSHPRGACGAPPHGVVAHPHHGGACGDEEGQGRHRDMPVALGRRRDMTAARENLVLLPERGKPREGRGTPGTLPEAGTGSTGGALGSAPTYRKQLRRLPLQSRRERGRRA